MGGGGGFCVCVSVLVDKNEEIKIILGHLARRCFLAANSALQKFALLGSKDTEVVSFRHHQTFETVMAI